MSVMGRISDSTPTLREMLCVDCLFMRAAQRDIRPCSTSACSWSRRFHRLIHRQKRNDRMLRSFDRKEHNEFHTHESRQITEPKGSGRVALRRIMLKLELLEAFTRKKRL